MSLRGMPFYEERLRRGGHGGKGRWGGDTGESGARENCSQDAIYEKRIFFSV